MAAPLMKDSEKKAKEKLKRKDLSDIDHVPVINRKGGRIEYNDGQSVSQGFGSGLRDIAKAMRKK